MRRELSARAGRLSGPTTLFAGVRAAGYGEGGVLELGGLTSPQPSSRPTLRASLFGTFLQTLPDLVTPLKGHSLSPLSCSLTPSERFVEDCGNNLAPKHARKHETHPPLTVLLAGWLGSSALQSVRLGHCRPGYTSVGRAFHEGTLHQTVRSSR